MEAVGAQTGAASSNPRPADWSIDDGRGGPLTQYHDACSPPRPAYYNADARPNGSVRGLLGGLAIT